MILLGLHGKAGSGKDTVAEMLRDALPEGTTTIRSFATPLKEVAKIKFRLTDEQVNTQEGKKEMVEDLNLSVRQLLELEGTEAARNIYGDDLWLWHMGQELEAANKSGYKVVIIPDARFENEAQFIKHLGGVIIGIERDLEEELATTTHASAQPLPEELIDVQLPNDGTLDELSYRVKDLVHVLKEVMK